MPTTLLQSYREALYSAQDAVRRHDKPAAMFCLGQALRLANRAHGQPQYRKAVFRAMSFVRRIGVEG